MTKRVALALAVALMVGASTSYVEAGFGLPKPKPSITNEKKEDQKLGVTEEKVDLDGMLKNQKAITSHMIACNNYAVEGWVLLNNSTGSEVTDELAAKAKLDENASNAKDFDECASIQEEWAKAKVDEAKVIENAVKVREAIAKAKEAKVTAENHRTQAATLLPGTAAEIAKCAKKALSNFEFAKEFKPVKNLFDINKKALSESDKDLKAINKRIAELEEILKKANA